MKQKFVPHPDNLPELYRQWLRKTSDSLAIGNLYTALQGAIVGCKDLESQSKKIYERAPAYLAQFWLNCYENIDSQENKEAFIQELIVLTEKNRQYAPLLCRAGLPFTRAWIEKHPEDYFKLWPSFREALFVEKQADEDFIDNLFKQAKRIFDNYYYTGLPEKSFKLFPDNEKNRRSFANQRVEFLQNHLDTPFQDLVQKDQQRSAIHHIDAYLKKNPGQYKKEFFQRLAEKMEKEQRFDVALLNDFLSYENPNLSQLFAKWSGRANSRAALLLQDLYQIANYGKRLGEAEFFSAIDSNKPLPAPERGAIELFVQSRIKAIKERPAEARLSSHLDRSIEREFAELMACSSFLKNKYCSIVQKGVEAAYQAYLMKKGREQAEASASPVFDTQGHVLCFVDLGEEDYKEILTSCGIEIGAKPKEQLEGLIGPVTDTSFCKLDCQDSEILSKKFNPWLDEEEKRFLRFADENVSINPLMEEMAFHMLLSLRVLEDKTDNSLDLANRQQLLQLINPLVLEQMSHGLMLAKGATDPIAAMNQFLDASREPLAEECRNLLVEFFIEKTGCQEVPELSKEDFTSKTATGFDFLRTDQRNQSIVRIAATEETAHNKVKDRQALRPIMRNRLLNGNVVPYARSSAYARVPSIAVVEEDCYQNALEDVSNKLHQSRELMQQRQPDYRGPMVYHLLTSLHTRAYDYFPGEYSNRQRHSARLILKGCHQYNHQQMKKGEIDSFTFIQNIPVNQHTNALDDSAFDDPTREATLFSNMALLSTLRQYHAYFPPTISFSIEKNYRESMADYQLFLPRAAEGTAYFSLSVPGKSVIERLRLQKSQMRKPPAPLSQATTADELMAQVLFRAYSQNAMYHPQYGLMIQTFSLYLAPMSQAGCKSGNERHQAVAGRLDLLYSVLSRWQDNMDNLSVEERQLIEELQNLAKGGADYCALQKALDTAYNQHNLYGAIAAIAEEDQGASSKVQASKNKGSGHISEINTNIAETSYLTRLSQKHSAGLQSHKASLAETFSQLFSDMVNNIQSLWSSHL